MHEKERQNDKVEVTERNPPKKQNQACKHWSDNVFIAWCDWNQRLALLKDFIVGQILEKNLNYSVLINISDEVIVHVEQGFKTIGEFTFVELLNLKFFHIYEKKKEEKNPMEFSFILAFSSSLVLQSFVVLSLNRVPRIAEDCNLWS